MARGFSALAPLVAQTADQKKGEDILLFDVHHTSSVTDYLLLVSVTSPAHLEAMDTAIKNVMNSTGVTLLHRDGSDSGHWRVLDYGGIMIHLMLPEAREFYALEKLFHDAPRRHWQAVNGTAARTRKPARRK